MNANQMTSAIQDRLDTMDGKSGNRKLVHVKLKQSSLLSALRDNIADKLYGSGISNAEANRLAQDILNSTVEVLRTDLIEKEPEIERGQLTVH